MLSTESKLFVKNLLLKVNQLHYQTNRNISY